MTPRQRDEEAGRIRDDPTRILEVGMECLRCLEESHMSSVLEELRRRRLEPHHEITASKQRDSWSQRFEVREG